MIVGLSCQAGADAFPGAEGYGKLATGGRGGTVCRVTTLADSGAGSLRSCVEACGPRTVIFDVSGTIELDSAIVDTCGQITIAGQSSPGGVQLKKAVGSDNAAPLQLYGGNVIVRYLRIRAGNGCAVGGAGCANVNADGLDALGAGSRTTIFDHISVQWGTDENFSFFGASLSDAASNGTLQWSMIAQPLDTGSSAGRQGYATIFLRSSNLSVHHNLFSHYRDRAPQWDGDGVLDFVNNVLYWMESGVAAGRSLTSAGGSPTTNYASNWAKRGPGSYAVAMFSPHADGVAWDDGGNVYTSPLTTVFDGGYVAAVSQFAVPHAITKTSATVARDAVLSEAGASKRIDCSGQWISNRDSLDTTIVDEFNADTGVVPDHPSEVGGWPTLTGGSPCADSDGDGMPNHFESVHAFDNSRNDSNLDRDADGYTNIEEWLNGTDPGAVPVFGNETGSGGSRSIEHGF